MILEKDITAWRSIAPWPRPDQVEHDLVLSRAICELYRSPVITDELVFRGGTALHKLFFDTSGRFSEDLDFVQKQAGPIGKTVDAIRDCLDEWLGKPSWKQNQGRVTLYYRFDTEISPSISRKLKIEINTREHFHLQPYEHKRFSVNSAWFTGESDIITFSIEELLATKLRALYQRKKGRDLYDFWFVMRNHQDINIPSIMDMFKQYMAYGNTVVSRAEFERNIFLKKTDPVFTKDIDPLILLNTAELYSIDDAYSLLINKFLPHLDGEPWKGI